MISASVKGSEGESQDDLGAQDKASLGLSALLFSMAINAGWGETDTCHLSKPTWWDTSLVEDI